MKQAFPFLSAIVLLASCSNDKAQPEPHSNSAIVKSAVAEAQPDSATMMNNWMTYMTPGNEHKMMTSWNGNWKGDITMWMAPDAPPTKTVGTTTNKMLLGDRYQQSTHTGSWDGQPFEGMSTLAFDNAKKVFISTWIDNMGTGMMMGEGPWDEASKSITIKGKMVDPSTLKDVAYREVFKIIDADTQVMEMYAQTPDGKGEFKTMEIKYTRIK